MKKLTYLAYVVMAVLFVTACQSLWQYYVSFEESNKGYGEARVMQVGLYSDHIRISVAMALSTVMAWHAGMVNGKRWHKVMVYGYILFQLAYLHILTARTGLVVLYIGMFVLALAYIAQYGKKFIPLGIGMLMLMPVLAYWFIPSFYNRVGFARYDFGYYSKQEYRQGSSDGFRYYSILSGIEAFRSEPLTGVGFKGLHEVNGQWFRTHFPEIRDEEVIQPSSAFVLHGAAAGILGLLVFLSFSLLPLTERSLWGNRYFLAIYAALSATWLFEILPENQYGIFVVGFFLSWAWWVAESSMLEKNENNN
ncbi:MAG: O-antigen ligase family protein [Saprospiraceae bacterium]|nr:O-antigen ligase family protein [Saprospiraceae bacterium]